MKRIILASGSPRRKELLKKIIKDFLIYTSFVDENAISEKDPIKFAVRAAELKARDIAEKFPQDIVIGADTIVVLNDIIFGKPKNHNEAKKMLKSLSGNSHKVITGVALYKMSAGKSLTDYEVTEVVFKKLTDRQIEDYLINYEVIDKAGSYAIQDIEKTFIEKINGNYDNVVGLPVEKLRRMLKLF